jgi:K+-sensing histidine kinase KdpD
MLELADTGTGMTPKTLARVFYPFFTTKEVGKGTGLGLSMVRGFVEQSGGYVDIESEIVRGTAVRIFLPRAEARNVTKTGSQVSLTINKDIKATVLVVEDDENVGELVILMLSDLAYAVIEAEDGNMALEL